MTQHVVNEDYERYSRRTFSNGLIIIGIFITCMGCFVYGFTKINSPDPSFSLVGIVVIIIGVLLLVWGIKRKLRRR